MHVARKSNLRLIAGGLGFLVLAGVLGPHQEAFGASDKRSTKTSAKVSDKAVKRGQYLVAISDCNACHTPWKMGANGPEPDASRLLSGHPQDLVMPPLELPAGPWLWAGAATNTAFYGPWGISYAPNLTPDENTGLGVWTEEIFVQAIRTGKHWGQSRPILPPMPWTAYAQMTDRDLKAIYAYLRTLPPIHNRVPDPVITEASPATAP